MADYGFNCIKLDDDWLGADFIAYHRSSEITLRVQLKARVTINKKYQGKDLWMAFPIQEKNENEKIRLYWCLVPHEKLVAIARETTKWLETPSWTKYGGYSSGSTPKRMLDALRQQKYMLDC